MSPMPMRPGGPPSLPPIPEVSPEEAKRLVEEENALVVDVREPFEWAEGHLPGALHMPLQSVPARSKELPRDRVLVMQCGHGYRSLQAALFLRAQGFESVVNLAGGIAAWEQDGLPVTQE